MKILCKLVWREMFHHRTRALLAVLAILATSCMVVWFVGNLNMAGNAGKEKAKEYFGNYSLMLTAQAPLDQATLDTIKTLDGIDKLDLAYSASPRMTWAKEPDALAKMIRQQLGTPMRGPNLLGTTAQVAPFDMKEGRWFKDSMECVLSSNSQSSLSGRGEGNKQKINVGDKIAIDTIGGEKELTVVGIFKQSEAQSGRGGGNFNTFAFGFGVGIGGGMKAKSPTPAPAQPGKPDSPAGQPTQPGQSGQPSAAPASSDAAGQPSAAPASSDVAGQPGTNPAQADSQNSGAQGQPGPNGAAPAAGMPQSPQGGMPPGLPSRSGPTAPAVYVSLADVYAMTVKADAEEQTPVNMVCIKLKKGLTPKEFYASLEKALGGKLADKKIQTADVDAMVEQLDQQMSMNTLVGQVWSALGLVLIASVFIIFTTLSMGVSERVRMLAMLRTIGLTRGQVAMTILLEGVALGILGWLGGLLAGWLLLEIMASYNAGEFVLATLSFPCIGIALICSLIGALIASIIPAIRATRISAVESMVRKSHNLSNLQLTIGGIIGLLLLSILPLIVFVIDVSTKTRMALFTTVGTLLLAIGFLFFLPWTIVLTEKILGPLVARILGLNPRFLANQLTSNQWRTLGTSIAMSIGLGLFTAVLIWTSSMLTIFTIPDTIPSTLVAFLPSGVTSQDVFDILKTPGLIEDDFMPLAVEQPKLDMEKMPAKWRESDSIGHDTSVVIGVDPQVAFRAENPTIRLQFLEGSREETLKALCSPDIRGCVISDAFSLSADLHVGDKVYLKKAAMGRRGGRGGMGMGGGMGGPGMGGRPEGAPDQGGMGQGGPGMGGRPEGAPGQGGMGQGGPGMGGRPEGAPGQGGMGQGGPGMGGRPEGAPGQGGMGQGGPGMGGRPEGAPGQGGMGQGGPGMGGRGGQNESIEYTVVGVVQFPGWQWLSKRSGLRVHGGRSGSILFASYDSVHDDLGAAENALFWFNTKPGTKFDDVFDHLQEIAKRSASASETTAGVNQSAGAMNQGLAQVCTVDTLNESLFGRSNSVIGMMLKMPLMILLLSTIAVLNAMVISVRARRWSMGVLRSYGVTRGGLVRMVLAEAILIGLCACVMSFSFGLFYAWLADGLVQYASMFGAAPPPLTIPWGKLMNGYLIAIAVSIVASIWPAISAGLCDPTSLLQRRD